MSTGLREQLGEAIFRVTAGPEGPRHRARIHGRPGPRWFDGSSPIGVVHGDASMFVGGLRALLLQTLHPAAMTAVAEHSDFRADMLGRLARTSRFIAETTFGHAEDAQRAVNVVRAIHDRVNGTLPDGARYSASDPRLLEWVHVAEVDSFLRAHTMYGRHPLDAAERDEYVAQTGVVARKLGVLDPPESEAELAARLEAFRPELAATDHAREAVSYVVHKPPLPRAARPAYGVLVAAAVGLLPPWTRQPLGLPWLPLAERTVVRTGGSLATGAIRWALTPGRQVAQELAAARAEG
ncbi:oxygenase MpaB family protein [Nocardioides sp.]|uniref:oxygenase MpaB family protein n=1 Tax=Nocardioides sp. TaxID=35761 RepID=UPI002ED472FE